MICRSVVPAACAVALLACGPPPAPPPPPVAAPGPGVAVDPHRAVLIHHLEGMLAARVGEAAREVAAIAGSMPKGRRDRELAWLLARADAAVLDRVVDGMDIPEVLRHRAALRGLARAGPSRGAAIESLARAGEVDVLGLVHASLREATSEDDFVRAGAAAGWLSPFVPAQLVSDALRRAPTARAAVALLEALGDQVGAEDLASVAAMRGARDAFAAALAAARTARPPVTLTDLRLDAEAARELLNDADDATRAEELDRIAREGATRLSLELLLAGAKVHRLRAARLMGVRPIAPRPSVAEPLRVGAADAIASAEACIAAAVRTSGARLRGATSDAAQAARMLGRLRTREAMVTLSIGLYEVASDELAGHIADALADAIGVAPAGRPEDSSERRRLWEPILTTSIATW